MPVISLMDQAPPQFDLQGKGMSNKITISELISELFSQPKETIKVMSILMLGEIGRWLYGKGKIRERIGDLIVCLMIFYLIRPHIIVIPPLYGIKLSPGAIAIIIALLGTHGIGRVFLYMIKKKTGIEPGSTKKNNIN